MKVKVYKIVRVDDNDKDWYDTAIQLATEDVSDFDAEEIDEKGWYDYDTEDRIFIEWQTDDVLQQRPDLTKEQAREVLHRIKQDHDCNHGITWETIDAWAGNMYPKKLRKRK